MIRSYQLSALRDVGAIQVKGICRNTHSCTTPVQCVSNVIFIAALLLYSVWGWITGHCKRTQQKSWYYIITHTHRHTHACTHTCTHTYTHMHAHTHTHIHTQHTHTHTHTRTRTLTRTRTHTHSNTYTFYHHYSHAVNPYVTVEVENAQVKTHALYRVPNPKWDKIFLL